MNPLDAREYFKQNRGFQRLFNLFIKKYQSLGRIGGSVRLDSLTEDEKEALSSMLRRDYSRQKSATVALVDFENALQKTRFSGIGLKELLDGFAGQNILSRADMEMCYQDQKDSFWQELCAEHSQEPCRLWLRHIEKKGIGTRGIHLAYDQNTPLLKKHLAAVLTALAHLPGATDIGNKQYERLPFFAERITSDPHGFDLDTEPGRFLLSALQFLRWQENQKFSIRSTLGAEEKTELLGQFGIIRDDLLNFATCCGILGFGKNEAEPSPLWQSAWEEGAVLNAPLREIIKIEHFMPALAFYHPNKEKVVYVLENSGVYSEVLDHLTAKKHPAILCTHGQIKLATLIMLDKLVQSGVTVYYSGDFDPEGLHMAQRILKRYGNFAKLWHYTVSDYHHSLSEVELDEIRLKKLDNISAPELIPLTKEIRNHCKVAYQEQLIKNLISDIRGHA